VNIVKIEHPYIPNAGTRAKKEMMEAVGKVLKRHIRDRLGKESV